MFKKLHLTLLLVTLRVLSFSQNVYHFDQTIPVEVAGKSIAMPWAGGLNSAQVNTIDLNFDGQDDLAVFDRTANKIFTYLNIGNQYTYAPDYEIYFPPSISQWVLLRDFNCDGRKDLFTHDPGGFAVYVNITKPGGMPTWRYFNPGHPLLTKYYDLSINLQMNGTDIPAIDDIDEDGDLDIIVGLFAGYGSMQYNKNMSIENTGRCDSMQLKFITTEWGNFQECNCGRYAFGGIYCNQLPAGGRVQHSAGKSLLTLDLDNDGQHDLLFSEQNCTSLYLLPNQGSRDTAQMNNFTIFPPTNPSTLLFPAAYYEDVDFDGIKDLVVSTNIDATVITDIDLSNSIWMYKNTGSNVLPQFNLQKKNLLQDQMIDAGSYSSPAFADFDADGDLDMFVSNWAVPDTVASIYQFENIGSFSTPSFRLVTNDYLTFSSRGLYNIKIQFADVDNDKKIDLAFTATDKRSSLTQLYFLKNNGNKSFDFSGQNPETFAFNFHMDQLENVFLFDVNKDGLLDIICGRNDGSLQYYKYFEGGFVANDLSYLGLNSDIARYCVSPTISDLHHDGKPDLLLGNHGSIVVYNDFQSNKNPIADTILISNQLKNSFESRSLSSFLVLTTADLYTTGNPLIVSGTITGGLYLLKSDSITSNSSENSVSVWPNPVDQHENFNVRVTQNSVVQFINVLGQKLSEPIIIPAGETAQITETLSSGLYFAKISWSGKSQTIKLIVK